MSLYELLQNGEADQGAVRGVAVGLVTNNKDPERMGRVKVTFPWRSAGDESHWARVAAFMAGKERGGYFLPEVGDEVLVAFEMGNLQHPYVIGALWNGEDKPPETNADGGNHIRKIKTRGGHELVFDDEEGKGKITLQTKAGNRLVLDDESGGRIAIESGSLKITMDAGSNEMTLESPVQLTLKSKAIAIEAESQLTLKAGAALTIKGAVVQIN
ncbi:phage baseplate assembly protein V [Paenibacillus thailandensis]|uniref:Phage baseplate assembly protein V n=1 Tax=Paenibacillus thailandensis TaxID=393250 RepID=A0ABW5QXS5_9BACL